jgi:hypothetical protein
MIIKPITIITTMLSAIIGGAIIGSIWSHRSYEQGLATGREQTKEILDHARIIINGKLQSALSREAGNSDYPGAYNAFYRAKDLVYEANRELANNRDSLITGRISPTKLYLIDPKLRKEAPRGHQ